MQLVYTSGRGDPGHSWMAAVEFGGIRAYNRGSGDSDGLIEHGMTAPEIIGWLVIPVELIQ